MDRYSKDINYDTGVIRCAKCHNVIGNYLEDEDYYKMIRVKYCNFCKEKVLREQKREAQKRYRERVKENKSELKKQNDLLKIENEALAIKLFGTDNTPKAKKMRSLLKQIADMD